VGTVLDQIDALGLPRLSDFGLPDTPWMAAIGFFVVALTAILSWRVLRLAYDVLYGAWWRNLATASVAFGFRFYAWSSQSGIFAAVTFLLFVPVTAEAVIA